MARLLQTDYQGTLTTSARKSGKIYPSTNAMGFTSTSLPYPDQIKYEEVIDIKSNVWNCLGGSHITSEAVPNHMRQYLVDLIHKVDRSNEELSMIQAEMQACHLFYFDQLNYIDDELAKETLPYYMKALLLSRRNEILRVLGDIHKSFGHIVELPIAPSPTEVLFLGLEPVSNDSNTHMSGSDDQIQVEDTQQEEVVDPDEELADVLNDLLGPVTDGDDDDNELLST